MVLLEFGYLYDWNNNQRLFLDASRDSTKLFLVSQHGFLNQILAHCNLSAFIHDAIDIY